jgi:hypothetical protein
MTTEAEESAEATIQAQAGMMTLDSRLRGNDGTHEEPMQ